MTLYQFLRVLERNCPVKIVDMHNKVLDSAYTKDALNPENFEYAVFKVGLNTIKNYSYEPDCISIMILK